MPDDIRAHPEYADGYYDALDDTPLFDDATEPYKAGWHAAMEAREMLCKAGLVETATGQFSMTLTLDGQENGEPGK